MIASNPKSSSALRHAERQQIEYRIKQLNLDLLRIVAQRRALVKRRQELNPEAVVLPPPPPPPPVIVRPPLPKRERVRGRGRIFTEEVLASIPQMLEEGLSREQIAERIGCKVASLIVNCSRFKISLRRDRKFHRRKEAA